MLRNSDPISSVVLAFIGYKSTSKQNDRQTTKAYIIYIDNFCNFLLSGDMGL